MRLQSLIAPLVIILVCVALLADSFGSSTTILSLTGVSSTSILYLGVMVLVLLRWHNQKLFHSRQFYWPVSIGLLISTLATASLSIWDYLTPANYVYAITRIQQQQLAAVSVFFGVLLLMTTSLSWWKKHHRRVLLFSPFIGLIGLVIVRLWPRDFFLQMIKEDQLIENLQVFVLLIGALMLFHQLTHYYHRLAKWEVVMVTLAMCVFTFFAGEEISWGQRIFDIASPEYMVRYNNQNEITVHNLQSIQWSVELGYAVIGILGGTLWVFRKPNTQKSQPVRWIVPSSHLIGFFLLPGIYYSYPLYSGENLIRAWAEVMELYLYIGLVTHVLESTLEKTCFVSKRKSSRS